MGRGREEAVEKEEKEEEDFLSTLVPSIFNAGCKHRVKHTTLFSGTTFVSCCCRIIALRKVPVQFTGS